MRLAVVCVVAAACTHGGGGTHALYDPSNTADFYATPYPDDLRRHADGTLDLSLFPTHSQLVDQYRQVAQKLDGFALNAAMFVRFDGPLDPTSLPDPSASAQPGAAVYVVNVDPSSPDFG